MKTLALVFVFLTLLPGQVQGAYYAWIKTGEQIELLLCPTGNTAICARKIKSVSHVGNGSYFQIVRGLYVPIGNLYYNGHKVFSFSSPQRGWIYKDKTGTYISAQPPANPQTCDFAVEGGSLLVSNGKYKTKHEIALYGEQHRNRIIARTIIVTKDGKIGIYHTTGKLWKIARKLKKEGIDYALNVDGGSSTDPYQKVANFFVFKQKPKIIKKSVPAHTTSWFELLLSDQFKKTNLGMLLSYNNKSNR